MSFLLKNVLTIISFFILLLPFQVEAQGNSVVSQDSIRISNAVDSIENPIEIRLGNTIDIESIASEVDTSAVKLKTKFKPDPKRAIIYSAIFPGLGQIYNRKYWKLPIVYGGFLGCAYAITWNSNQYNEYSNAIRDFTDENPNTNSWTRFKGAMNTDVSAWNSSEIANFTNRLQRGKDFYRRYRDLSYIITVGVYALTMIDAYVDAQLFDFDISPDLSMKVEPVLFEKSAYNSRSLGLQCSFKF